MGALAGFCFFAGYDYIFGWVLKKSQIICEAGTIYCDGQLWPTPMTALLLSSA
jgi:hypothetical protein